MSVLLTTLRADTLTLLNEASNSVVGDYPDGSGGTIHQIHGSGHGSLTLKQPLEPSRFPMAGRLRFLTIGFASNLR